MEDLNKITPTENNAIVSEQAMGDLPNNLSEILMTIIIPLKIIVKIYLIDNTLKMLR